MHTFNDIEDEHNVDNDKYMDDNTNTDAHKRMYRCRKCFGMRDAARAAQTQPLMRRVQRPDATPATQTNAQRKCIVSDFVFELFDATLAAETQLLTDMCNWSLDACNTDTDTDTDTDTGTSTDRRRHRYRHTHMYTQHW